MLLFFIYKQSNPTLIYIWLTLFLKWVNLFRRLSMRRIDELTAEINEATLQLPGNQRSNEQAIQGNLETSMQEGHGKGL